MDKVAAITTKDTKEILDLISQLSKPQKEIMLATLRGAVLMADSNKEE